ncbi:MAG: hypothetical protein A2024_05550 [Candidatus Edwardsbacteria bacterium GWF2_54_11]|uniref:Uracil-DNA glycosylase-like domain-containing protein n=1 Tax=Candidatus Edwardsbacteria bacterium GWF2_54_11 TaxID=1817851 RepID=A0A1F5RIY1_9BACT|nr:MAG: hypothetical protein A2502_07135 [Candidatus Edwardsbacteria bacterium RifOxyC12_full_54_24]OGF14001.1 MAG: hypothetical protein A2024_05550 [Candidatus Edwardsbacteria bacterium GWF2_54_11]OGJ17595.1 MAG: hypothetical protein A2349_04290 [Candidatus Edwardsbacteria bacterium RifOxyB12_full_52_30]
MKNKLLKEWGAYKPIKPPYILKGDKALLSFSKHSLYTNYNTFIKNHHPADTKTIHLGLLPVPYAGNLAKAKIFILLLNPGFKPINYFTEYNHKPYRQALLNNLKQKNLDAKYPFLFLNPSFLWTGGGSYWSQKFGKIIEEIMGQKGWEYQKALSHISQKVAIIQSFPYHSGKYSLTKKETKKLASPKLAREYVRNVLKKKAESGKILVLVTRHAKAWGIEGRNIINFKGPDARAAHLVKYQKKILEYLDI